MADPVHFATKFISPENYSDTMRKLLAGPNGWLLFVAANSGIELAEAVKMEYERMLEYQGSALKEVPLVGTYENPITRIFADTETCPRLPQHVAGSNAYVFANTHQKRDSSSVNENIQQLLQVIRTLKTHRASQITVVTPYSPYSRQDKPSFMRREATFAGLFADQLKIAGADIHLAYHPHSYSLYGLYEPNMKLVALNGLDLFLGIFERFRGQKNVIAVSTDSGGAKFTIHLSNAMEIPYAICNKYRCAKDDTQLLGLIGDLTGKDTAIITDDETVTGSSIINAVRSLHFHHGIENIYAAISHAKIVPERIPDLVTAHEKYGLKELHITDTIPQVPELLNLHFIRCHPVAERFAATINRMHYNRSIGELFYSEDR